MFFVVIGAVLGAPVVFNFANRVLEEITIPKQELKKIRRRRAAQQAAGISEEESEVTKYVPLEAIAKDAEFTQEEWDHLHEIGAVDVILRGVNRRTHIKRQEDRERAAERAEAT
jgi:hypothetical protein